MRYIISDIHGCYEEYQELLEKIHFSDEDDLFVLGDSMDRGPEPIKVIQDMMARHNVIYILGNHDYMMMSSLKRLAVEVTESNCENYLRSEDIMNYYYWVQDGGRVTSRQFTALPRQEQQDILEYLGEALIYEVLEDKGKEYVLVHAGIQGFDERKDLDAYDFKDFIFCRTDYEKRYYEDENVFVVTGHTPTPLIRSDRQPRVYQGNGHIALDCGCVFGGNLAAYCIETGEICYVRSKRKDGPLGGK